MGIIASQGIKTSIVSYLGVALGAFNTLWLYPKFLSTDEIGLISILTSISLLIAPIAQFGTNSIIIKYYPYVKKDKNQMNSFLSFVILIPTVGFLISIVILFFCRSLIVSSFIDKSPLIIDYLFAVVPFTFVLVGRNIADSLARANFKVTIPKLFKEVHLRVVTFLVVILYSFFNLPLDFLVYGVIFAFTVNFFLILLYLKKIHFGVSSFNISYLPRELIKNALIYGSFIILSGFAGLIVTKIDGWMIASKISLNSTGIYTIALYIGLTIEMPKRSMNLISMPVIGDAIRNNDLKVVKSLYEKSALTQLVIGSLLLICIWINIDEIFQLIPNSATFREGKYVVLFIGLAVLVDMTAGVNNEIILMSSFYRWNILIMLSLVIIAIINNNWLIPIYGINGAAIATLISVSLYNAFKYLLVYNKLRIQPFSINTIKAIVISTITFIIAYILPKTGVPLIDIIYRSSLIIILYTLTHFYLKISIDITNILKKTINQIKNWVSN